MKEMERIDLLGGIDEWGVSGCKDADKSHFVHIVPYQFSSNEWRCWGFYQNSFWCFGDKIANRFKGKIKYFFNDFTSHCPTLRHAIIHSVRLSDTCCFFSDFLCILFLSLLYILFWFTSSCSLSCSCFESHTKFSSESQNVLKGPEFC